jgi:uncharacterized protein YceH (UPF0502 family)
MELTAAEGRVLACLIERAAVAPDAYPVTLNELRLSCNQTSGREPVVAYDDRIVEDTLLALKSKGLARSAAPGPMPDRAARYSHRADGRWRLGPAELAVLAVLLLCGPQTLGAVQARAARLYPFADSGEVEAVLDALAARTPAPFAARLDSPTAGDRVRWAQVLAGPAPGVLDGFEGARVVHADLDGRADDGHDPFTGAPTYAELAARVAELERRLAAATERSASAAATAAAATAEAWEDEPDASSPPGERRWSGAAGATPGRRSVAGGGAVGGAGVADRGRAALPPATRVEADGPSTADRLADIERRLARIEAELGALR